MGVFNKVAGIPRLCQQVHPLRVILVPYTSRSWQPFENLSGCEADLRQFWNEVGLDLLRTEVEGFDAYPRAQWIKQRKRLVDTSSTDSSTNNIPTEPSEPPTAKTRKGTRNRRPTASPRTPVRIQKKPKAPQLSSSQLPANSTTWCEIPDTPTPKTPSSALPSPPPTPEPEAPCIPNIPETDALDFPHIPTFAPDNVYTSPTAAPYIPSMPDTDAPDPPHAPTLVPDNDYTSPRAYVDGNSSLWWSGGNGSDESSGSGFNSVEPIWHSDFAQFLITASPEGILNFNV
ncbi:hypothetical protein C8R46DRAFT_27721 [Mycena filopes]|nr:hypothetical protein C8R46DRAFT_27721 [Mycena filopes]